MCMLVYALVLHRMVQRHLEKLEAQPSLCIYVAGKCMLNRISIVKFLAT